ncbi:DUF1403 family protein [Rhizobium sp. L1K21]|uniref:DUF1403 family protein n=1 Tax=Rhizobium sp. L1K21 TaxID=2954933 RepID=UPI002092D616|nr:DUF1403 family protein [Rhizobium sp. L1K21]MCO6188660.1 DUF1403 family protein [Rhizobium sp. L1K21]
MDSRLTSLSSGAVAPTPLPGWALSRGSDEGEADAAFSAGIALKSIDDLVRSNSPWAGCWRERQALTCAASAVRLMGRNADEAALRDAVLLTAAGDDPGPAGNIYLAFKRVVGRKPAPSSKSLGELTALLGLRADETLDAVVEQFDAARQSGRAVPFAIAELVSAIYAVRPDAEALAWILADQLMALRLKWERPVPLFMAERFGRAFKTIGGRGRVLPGEPAFARAVCLALVDGVDNALRSAGEINRRAERLAEAARKIRTRGGGIIIEKLLGEDAILASAPGSGLSRWASTRMFDRLETFAAVRELSGRSSFKIYGL